MSYPLIRDVIPTNDKNEAHGYYKIFYPNGQLVDEGNMINNKESGCWKHYNRYGKLNFIEYYII